MRWLHATTRLATSLIGTAAILATFAGLTSVTPARAQAGCGAAMPDFQAALKANTAAALTAFLEQHAPCFEKPARARLEALGDAVKADASPETDPAPTAPAVAETSPAPEPQDRAEPKPREQAGSGETITIKARIKHSHDDVEERTSDGTMYMNSTDLELVNDEHVGGDQIIGLRFEALDIGRGAKVTSASVVFQVDEPAGGNTGLELFGEASGTAERFTKQPGSVSTRPRTAARVDWTPEPWETVGETSTTPDLSAIIQEIINRDDWTSGNSLALFVTGSGRRTGESFDGNPEAAPELSITLAVQRQKMTGLDAAQANARLCEQGFTLLSDNMYAHPNDPAAATGTPLSWNEAYRQFETTHLAACRALGEFVEANRDDPGIAPIFAAIGQQEFYGSWADYFDGGHGIVVQGSRIPNYCPDLHLVQFNCLTAPERISASIGFVNEHLATIRSAAVPARPD